MDKNRLHNVASQTTDVTVDVEQNSIVSVARQLNLATAMHAKSTWHT